MAPPKHVLKEQLVATESLNTVCEGMVVEDATQTELVIGVTDRRLLGCSGDGEFLDVKQEYITAIRSRLRTTSTYQGIDDRLVAAVGGAVAAIAFVALVLYAIIAAASTGVAIGLTITTIAGTGLAAFAFRRHEDGPESPLSLERGLGFEFDPSSDRQRILVAGIGGGLLAVGSVLWLVRAVPGPLATVLVLVTLGGLALAWYGSRTENEFDGLEFATQYETVVEITTVDGQTLELRTDPAVNLERELGRYSTHSHGPSLEVVRPDTT